MSWQAPFASNPAGQQGGGTHLKCPRCNGTMTVVQVLPVLFAPDVDDVIFRCEPCATEIKRSVRRS